MKRKVMICCAITGGSDNHLKSAAVPVTPAAIVESALGAAAAGASIVHIHVRDRETGKASMALDLYREVFSAIRAGAPDLVVNLTTGIGGRYVPGTDDVLVPGPGTTLSSPRARAQHVATLHPDACSLDMGTMNLGSAAFINTPPHIAEIAAIARAAGAIAELEVFDAGGIELAKAMMADGRLDGPGLFQLCMGVSWGAPATSASLMFLASLLPPDALWFAFGVGRHQFPIAAQTVLLGGHVRVGLEDNLYLDLGVPAETNAQLVEKAADIIRLLGCDVATAVEARRLLAKARVPAAE